MKKNRVNVYLSNDSYQYLVDEKNKTGSSFSSILDLMILEHKMKTERESEEFLKEFSDKLLEKLKPYLINLRSIANDTNVVTRTNKEILNYMLLANNYVKEFDTNGEDKDHLVTIKSSEKIREQINDQRLKSLDKKLKK